jgi:hypothetical protein
MDCAGVGLCLVSLALFLAALVFSTRPGQRAGAEQPAGVSGEPGAAAGHKAVIVELPGVDNIPDEYIVDLKVLISKNNQARLKEGGQAGPYGKKINRLDKYL